MQMEIEPHEVHEALTFSSFSAGQTELGGRREMVSEWFMLGHVPFCVSVEKFQT